MCPQRPQGYELKQVCIPRRTAGVFIKIVGKSEQMQCNDDGEGDGDCDRRMRIDHHRDDKSHPESKQGEHVKFTK